MAKVQTPHYKEGKPPMKKNTVKLPKRVNRHSYCILCRKNHLKHEAQEHMHSMLHHRELDIVLGKDLFHECQACKATSMDLNQYAQHISTTQHQAKLKSLMSRKVKPLSLCKTLSKESMDWIQERNKILKKEEKKATNKKKKKRKQVDGQKRAEQLMGGSKKNTVVSKQVNKKVPQQGTFQQGKGNAVVQNKENKVSSLQKPLHQRESTLQNQSGGTWCYPRVRDQCTQSAQQMTYDDNYYFKLESTGRLIRIPHSSQGDATTTPGETSWANSQDDYYSKQYNEDFINDHLPHNGAIIFDHGQSESARSCQPGEEGSAQPASANGSANAAPIRDVDVSAMLRQIRRALGVREPCRADREARKQNSGTMQRAAATSSQVNSSVPESQSCVCPPNDAPPKGKQTTLKMTQGTTLHCEKSSMFASDSNGPSQGCHDSQTTSSEPKMNKTCKVRIAHESAKAQGGKQAALKPTLNKLFRFSGAKNKSNWREVYEETKRKKQERSKGVSRFGTDLANSWSDQKSSTQAKDNDMILSEGFHWESVPDNPSGAHWTAPPPPPQNTTHNESHTETQSDSQIQEPVEQPGAAREGCSSHAVKAVHVKVEPHLEDENRDLRANSSASKRKQNMYDDTADKEPSRKKKTKSNKDQGPMDQLLAVSLREDELSHSLQDLDKSLMQARNALQAAYREVQGLILLRQQFTAEVNSLRAQRIEILQGMQGGFAGAEKAATSSAGTAAVMQPRLSPLSSFTAFPASPSQQPSPTNPASSKSPLAMPTMPVKKEIFQPSPAGQASQFAKTVSCNPDTQQVAANQPLPLFPSDLLPLRLLPSPHLAAPTTAVTSLKQPRKECSTSAYTSDFPEPSARQQTSMLGRGEAEPVDSDNVEEVSGNMCMEQVKEKEPAAKKSVPTFVPERGENASAAAPDDDGGNESDASVKMMEPSNLVIIDIDESDNEDTAKVPVHKAPPQKSVSVEFSSLNTPTSQQSHAERRVQPTAVKDVKDVKDVRAPSEVVDLIQDEEPSVGAFENHTGPVHGLHVHDGRLYTCSGDNTARAYSLMNRECQAVFEGHTNKVNCLLVSSPPNMPPRLYTGSSDQTIRCYSIKTAQCLDQITISDRVLCLHVAWNILYAGLANGSVASYDLKTLKHLDVFECHGPRGVSCLGTAQEGARRVLLVGSYDSTISVRDAKNGLLLRSLEGHSKTVLCMKVVNDLVFSGSSDTSVHAHNIHTGELIRIYKGHGHAVTSIVILGKVMLTACLDKLVRVYELQSHDRLQVYGGHSDMVMCMVVHKSVVYTGCYDGSVQAVKLNLLKNYRCWWQNCTLIFGVPEHLVHHLVRDHSNTNLQALKCRWRGCDIFFNTQQSIRQKLPAHMQSHVDKDSNDQP